jgi:hypothetical protein
VPDSPDAAAARLGVFTLDEALAAGWTPKALRHALHRGRLARLRPGVFAAPQPRPENPFAATRQSLCLAATAAALANPRAMVSHASAAALDGLPLWREREVPCLTVPPHFVGDIEGVHLHRAAMPDGHVTHVGAIRTATVARSVIDIGREEGALSALVTADAALHTGRVTLATLRDRVRECSGWPGVRAARQAIEFADGLAESPLESASRFKLDGRVPPPELQVSIYGDGGMFLGRCDFYWDEEGVVGEADGMQKYDDDPQLRSLRDEKVRQRGLERLGLIVVRWGHAELDDIDALAREINEARDRGARRSGPRRWSAVHGDPRFAPFPAPTRREQGR